MKSSLLNMCKNKCWFIWKILLFFVPLIITKLAYLSEKENNFKNVIEIHLNIRYFCHKAEVLSLQDVKKEGAVIQLRSQSWKKNNIQHLG